MAKLIHFVCMSDHCTSGMDGHHFHSQISECPVCKSRRPAVVRVLVTHFLVQDAKGKIVGNKGTKKRLACDPSCRKDLRWVEENYCMASAAVEGVNCPECRASPEWQGDYEACCQNENFNHVTGGESYGA